MKQASFETSAILLFKVFQKYPLKNPALFFKQVTFEELKDNFLLQLTTPLLNIRPLKCYVLLIYSLSLQLIVNRYTVNTVIIEG